MHDLAVIGAGITGLFTAATAAARGLDVVALEAGDVPGEQSRGEGRIFRVAHANAHLCTQALRAAEGWRAWEREAGELLVHRCGLVLVGEAAADRLDAMKAAGAEAQLINPERVPQIRLRGDVPVLWDPAGGAIRTRRVTRLLQGLLGDRLRAGTPVKAAKRHNGGWTLAVPGGEVQARHAVACAGTHMPEVAELFGVATPVEVSVRRTLRLTFAWEGGERVPCVIDRSGANGIGSYSLPTELGYSVGMTGDPVESAEGALSEPDFRSRAKVACQRYRRERVVGTGPTIVEEVDCRYVHSEAMPDGDGWRIFEGDGVRVLLAANAYKFAPLLAEQLLS